MSLTDNNSQSNIDEQKATSPTDQQVASERDPLRESLESFFKSNPEAKYVRTKAYAVILNAWCDESIELRIPLAPELNTAATRIVRDLNNLVLPKRFTAIWHKDTRDLEFIFDALPPSDDLAKRAFEFRFRGRCLQCEFSAASPELETIALAFSPSPSSTETEYRNLRNVESFYMRRYKRRAKPDHEVAENDDAELRLVSFWIRKVEWTESDLTEIAEHLNFFMTYFDRETPMIRVHVDEPSAKVKRPPRYPLGEYPAVISARKLDPFLLGLWRSAYEADTFRKFLHYFQVLEYAAFYYMKEETLQRVKRILTSPDIAAKPSDAARQIFEAAVENQMNDDQKLSAMVARIVEPQAIWTELERNIESFSTEVIFEGGFALPPLLKKGWTVDDFQKIWIPAFPDQLRWMRNAIVHAREKRVAKVITPSPHNYAKLLPWVGPIRSAAMQVVLFWESTVY